MGNYALGFTSKILDIIPNIILIGGSFIAMIYITIPIYKKVSFFKLKKLNLITYVILGLIILGAISYWVGHDTSTPCISTENDSHGTSCVEYDSTYTNPTKTEQERASGGLFATLLPSFFYSIYLIRKENTKD